MNEQYLGEFQHAIIFSIECYERALLVCWNGDPSRNEMLDIFDRAYDQWVNIEENPEVEDYCVEEWLLLAVDDLGIDYKYIYIQEES